MQHIKRFIASFLVVCITSMGLPMQAYAGIVSTQEASASNDVAVERERVATFFTRDDVRKALEAQGVSPQAAMDRVHSLSDEEVVQLAGRIDQAPAGGDIVGVIFTIFIVLLLTDILGFTKIFPFTRSIR